MTFNLSEISIYPVKSLREVKLQRTMIEQRGAEFDRRWMVVDDTGKFITQRECAKMALIDVTRENDSWRLSFEDSSVTIPRIDENILVSSKVRVWSSEVDALDTGDLTASWLSANLGRSCRLVLMPNSSRRETEAAFSKPGDIVSFADGFPLLLISQASLEELNRRISSAIKNDQLQPGSVIDSPMEMVRFRPNLVVSGCQPFEEDTWRLIKIGDITFEVVKPCSRCAMPSIDPLTAKKSREPWKTLSSFRKSDGEIFFGQNLIPRGIGVIKTGDEIELVETSG